MNPFLRPIKTEDTEGYQFWCPACASIDPRFYDKASRSRFGVEL